MELDRVRVEFIEKKSDRQKTFGFKFMKNHEICEIFTNFEEVYREFKEKLVGLCIQVDFNHRYQTEKLIGKGSFGRVLLSSSYLSARSI
jgi:hypothetical protein